MKRLLFLLVLMSSCLGGYAQKYGRIIDKSVAVIGGELVTLSDIEAEIQMMSAQGQSSDRNMRCEVLERMMESKLFLMQSRVDSLNVNRDAVESELNQRMAQVRTALGGDEAVEEYFKKSPYKLRAEWKKQLEEMSLTQQEQQQIASSIPDLTPYDVREYLDTVRRSEIPVIPAKYQMSQICIYPDREAAANAVKERLLAIRERIINGEKFSTLARLYSEDKGSARKGGELGMASKSIFWPAFSDAAMALKKGMISQIVETPDGYHIIEVIDRKGDMFNARHILMKPSYTAEDREKAFAKLDSIRNVITVDSTMTFELAARYYSQDPATLTNGGQMADPNTGSAYFEIDQIKPEDYTAVASLKPGEISSPIESRDNEGRDGNLVYKIVRLDRILPSHTANFENDYTELLSKAKQARQKKAIDDFIDSKIKTTFITIDPLFSDCDFSRPEWSEKVRKQ